MRSQEEVTKGRLLFFGLFSSLVAVVLTVVSSPINAQTMNTINFQGKVVRNDSGSEGLNVSSTETTCISGGADTCGFQVVYYDASTGGNTLGTETFTNVEIGDYDGVVNLGLGTGSYSAGTESTFVDIFTNNSTTYAEVKFDHDGNATYTEVFGRMAVRGAAYAIHADTADSINGMDEGDFVQFAPNSVQTDTSTVSSIFINKTGASGNILQLQKGGSDYLVLDNDGDLSLTNDAIITGLTVGKGPGSGSDNTVLGSGSLADNTSGNQNTAIGLNTISTNVTGAGMTAVGAYAMQYADDGLAMVVANTALGSYALRGSTTASNNTGVDNTAIGYQTLMSNTSGSANVALGVAALEDNTEGDSNVGLGRDALHANQTGNNNIGVGYRSGYNLTSGSDNILIGYNVYAPSATADDQLSIGNLIFATGGFGTGTSLGAGNVGIGDASPAAKFVVGNGDLFQVNSSGAIAAATGVTSSGTITFSGLSTAGVTMHSAGGVLSTATVQTCSGDDKLQFNGTNFVCATDQTGPTYTAGNDIDFNGSQIDIESHLDYVSVISQDSASLTLQTTTSGDITLNPAGNVDLSADIIPDTDDTYDIGSSTARIQDIYIGDSSLHIGVDGDEGIVSFNTTSDRVTIDTDASISGLTVGKGGSGFTYNTILGVSALSNTTGDYNTAVGYQALLSNVGNTQSTAVGYQAMRYADNRASGQVTGNTALGYMSLMGSTTAANNTGQYNTAVGANTLRGMTSGGSNVAVGSGVMFQTTTGSYNIGIGASALSANTTGQYNVGIGYGTLGTNQANSRSIAIGNFAMQNADNRTSGRDTYNTAIGYAALLGSGTPANNTGQFNTVVGDSAMMGNTSGRANVAIGMDSMRTNTTGQWNVAVGLSSLYSNLGGSSNVALGLEALYSNETGNSNVAIGLDTMFNSVSGTLNVAIGYATMLDNETGGYNVAIGPEALSTNVANTRSTAIGYQAMYYTDDRSSGRATYNTAVGYKALEFGGPISGNTGQYNTAIGDSALNGITSGSSNIGLGINAGDNISTGSTNIMIGYDIDAQGATSSNQLSIGNLIFATGGFGTGTTVGTGNVGIGDASPSAKFVVGNGDLFQVNSSGAITAATGITSSGTITFSGLSTAGVTMHNASGVLSTATVATCSGDDKLQFNGTNFVCDTDETGAPTAGNDIDVSGTQVSVESQLDYVTTITRASSDLTLSTTTSGDLVLNPVDNVDLRASIIPNADDTYDIGSSSFRIRDLYLGPTTIHMGEDGDESTISFNTATNTVEIDSSEIGGTGFTNWDKVVTDDLTTSTSFGGDLSGSYNSIVVSNDSHTHSGTSLTGVVLDGTAGNYEVASSTNDDIYTAAAIELRELNLGGAQTGSLTESPRISFHWGGRVASQIGMNTGGDILIMDNPGTGYEQLVAQNIWANGGFSTYDTTVTDNYIEAGGLCLGNGTNCRTTWPTSSTYTAGNDLDLSGSTFNIESTLNYVSTITRASSDLTLSTTTSGNIYLNPANNVYLGVGSGAADDLYIPDRIIDWDSASYYLDPNSTSSLYSITVAASIDMTDGQISDANVVQTNTIYSNEDDYLFVNDRVVTQSNGNQPYGYATQYVHDGSYYDTRMGYDYDQNRFNLAVNGDWGDNYGGSTTWTRDNASYDIVFYGQQPNNTSRYANWYKYDGSTWTELVRFDSTGKGWFNNGTGTFSPYLSYNYTQSGKTRDNYQLGDVVSLTRERWTVARSNSSNRNSVLGVRVVPEGFISIPKELKNDLWDEGKSYTPGAGQTKDIEDIKNVIPVANLGEASTKVTTVNGVIYASDPVSASAVESFGAKATDEGQIVGKALETTSHWSPAVCPTVSSVNAINWPADDGSNPAKPCFRVPVSGFPNSEEIKAKYNLTDANHVFVGKIMVFVNVTSYQPNPIADRQTLNEVIADYKLGLLGGSFDGDASSISITYKDLTADTGTFQTLAVGTGFTVSTEGNVSIAGDLVLGETTVSASEGTIHLDAVFEAPEIITQKLNIGGALEANRSTDVSIIPVGSVGVKIYTTAVTEDSLIFITPKNSLEGDSLYVSEQGEGYFIVMMETEKLEDIEFNWWAIN